MLRATDKLAEARFFVRQLSRTKGKLPVATYYASAAISALRSVTWVLQADLRPRYGVAFDNWWESERGKLADLGLGFALLRDSRNESEKLGSPLTRRVVRQTFQDGLIESLDFLIDPGFETLANFRVRPRASQLDPAAFDKAVFLKELNAKVAHLRDCWLNGTAEMTTVFGSTTELPFDTAVDQLRKYQDGLVLLVRDAARKFAA